MSAVVAPNVPNVTRARGRSINKTLSYFLFYTHARVTFGTFAWLRFAGHGQHGPNALLACALATTGTAVARGGRAGVVEGLVELPPIVPPELLADLSTVGWHVSYMGAREDGGGA